VRKCTSRREEGKTLLKRDREKKKKNLKLKEERVFAKGVTQALGEKAGEGGGARQSPGRKGKAGGRAAGGGRRRGLVRERRGIWKKTNGGCHKLKKEP